MGHSTSAARHARQPTRLVELLDQAQAALAAHARHAARGSLARGQHHWLPAGAFLGLAAGKAVPIEFGPSQKDGLDMVRRIAGEGASVGFPVQLDDQDGVRPLLSLSVSLELTDDGIVARATPPLRLNVGLLRQFGLADGELRRLEAALGGDGLLAADAARLIAGRAGLPNDWPQWSEPGASLSDPPPQRPVWLGRACLLPPEAMAADMALINGLDRLRETEPARLAGETALAGLLAPSQAPVGEPQLVWEMSPAQPSHLAAIQRALAAPLTALEAPPGSGAFAMLLSLTATACMRNETVLYLASSADTIERFARAWDGALGRGVRAAVCFAQADGLTARAKALSDYLYLLAKPAGDNADKDGGKRKHREKPTVKMVRELDRTPSPVTPQLLEQYQTALAALAAQPSAQSGSGLAGLLRLPDIRQLDNQRQGIAAAKLSAVRELVQDKLRERLLLDPLALQRDCRELFRLAGGTLAGPAADSALTESIDATRQSLPVWAVRLDLAERLLPARPALFDLAIVDEADCVALPELLGVFARARRVLLLGQVRNERRALWPPPADTTTPAGDLGRSALAAVQALAPDAALRLGELVRPHPVIGDYLSRCFYGHKLQVRTDYRKQKQDGEPALCGLHWHPCHGRLEAGTGGPVNRAQAGVVIRLLENWQAAHWLTVSQTLAIVAQLPGQPALLRQRLRRSDLTDTLLRRIAVYGAEEAPREAFDYVLLLPGPVGKANASLNATLARSRAVFHDGAAAARLGLHVIGDRQAAERAGGPAGSLAALAEDWRLPAEPPPPAMRKPPDPTAVAAEALRRILSSQGLPWQEGLREGERTIEFRVLAPFGGCYALSWADGADAEPPPSGLICLRLSPEAVAKRDRQMIELLRRLV